MYSSLHNHSMYSLLDGYATQKEYLDRAKEIGLKAFAITEHGNEYSWCYFDKLKKDYPDIKMIYGVEFYECFDMDVKDKESKYFHLVVLARNENGRKAINKLVTKSNLEGFYYKPRVDLNAFRALQCGNDIVVTSACLASKLSRESNYQKCIDYIEEYKNVFPYFYLELQSHAHQDQAFYNNKILQLANDTNTDFIITTDSHAATKEDLFYQGKHVQIAHDTETASEAYEGCYLQTIDEIHEIMDEQIGYDAVEQGLKNTNVIADLISEVDMPFKDPELPTFPLPEGFETNYDYVKHLVKDGWFNRGFNKLDDNEKNIYRKRLEYELDIIHSMGFDGYFLVVWDFINFAKENGVMVGAGRGSGAGSLVCYTMHITDLDPIKYGLIFERFLNPERISMPDLDIDVSDRATVINYLINKYGSTRVCQIINFSYITPVVAIKDVGKILGFNYNEMDKLSKRFTYDTFEECIKNNQTFVDDNPKYQELFNIAGKLSGRIKTVSCHAGGVGIVDTDIDDYMAMKLGSDGEHVISVDKRIIEEIGIIKFDILGVQTLTMVKEAQEDANISEYDININNPVFENDTKSYELLCKAMTNGVFQVESAGMKDLLYRLQPSSMEDISAVLALYRPDSMGALEEYIECKNGIREVSYLHPDMKPILESTYGCCIRKGQIISTENGNKPIEDIKNGDFVYTKTGKHKVVHAWCNGIKNIFTIKFGNGKVVQTTNDHKFLTQSGWKMLKDITTTDVVAMRIGTESDKTFDKNKLKMIGYLLGDGGLTLNNGIHFYNSDEDLVLDFKHCVEAAYQETIVAVKNRIVPSGSYVYDCSIRSKNPYHTKYQFNSDLAQWGLRIKEFGTHSQAKFVPKFIFGLNRECLKTFLGSYLDTDGCYTSRGHIRFKTISKTLAEDVQEVIRLIGYNATIITNNDNSFDIIVSNCNEFTKEMLNYSIKVSMLYDKNLATGDDRTNCIHRDYITDITKTKMKELNIKGRESINKYGTTFLRTIGSKRSSKYVSISTLEKIQKDFNYPELWFDRNIYWIKVKDIIDENICDEVYDLEIESDHSFVVNGIVVHNCIYQEQILEIVRKFAGRTYGGADLFRKAIGKKDINLVRKEADKLYQEILDNGYSESIARQISDELSTKGGYCFNKSHSYSYAVLCFQTAYLKTYYPAYFFKALFNLNKDKAGMVNKYIIDAKAFNVSVKPPHINKSERNFSIDNGQILFGLSAIKGIGESFTNNILNVRGSGFTSLEDFIEKANPSKSQVISLIKAGAIPTKDKKKALIKYLKSMYEPLKFKPVSSLPSYVKLKEEWHIDPEDYRIGEKRFDYDKDKMLEDFNKKKEFEFNCNQQVRFQKYIDENKKYLENEEFWEFESLQIFINNNPFDKAYNYLVPFEDVQNGDKCTIVGVISKVQKKKDKHKKQFAFINIYSSFGLVEGIVWHTQLKEYEDIVKTGQQLALLVKKDSEDKVVIDKMKPYSVWLEQKRKAGVAV